MGANPSKGTPADRRLKANTTAAPAKKATAAKTVTPAAKKAFPGAAPPFKKAAKK